MPDPAQRPKRFRYATQPSGCGPWAFPDRESESVAQKPKFTDDWDKERKRVRILSLVLVVVLAIVAVLIALSILRGHLY